MRLLSRQEANALNKKQNDEEKEQLGSILASTLKAQKELKQLEDDIEDKKAKMIQADTEFEQKMADKKQKLLSSIGELEKRKKEAEEPLDDKIAEIKDREQELNLLISKNKDILLEISFEKKDNEKLLADINKNRALLDRATLEAKQAKEDNDASYKQYKKEQIALNRQRQQWDEYYNYRSRELRELEVKLKDKEAKIRLDEKSIVDQRQQINKDIAKLNSQRTALELTIAELNKKKKTKK